MKTESHHVGVDEALHELHAERYRKLKLKVYGITFEQYLEEPFAYETVLQLPAALRQRLMDAATQPTPMGEMLRMWNLTMVKLLKAEEDNERLARVARSAEESNRRFLRDSIRIEQVAREKEMLHSIAMLRGVGNIQGEVLLTTRLEFWRALRRKESSRAQPQPNPLATETQAQP